MAEVFGRENHVATIPFQTSTNQSTRMIPEVGNWIVWFAKDKSKARYCQLYQELNTKEKIQDMVSYAMCDLPDGSYRNLTKEEKENPQLLPDGARIFESMPVTSSHTSMTGRSEPFEWNGIKYLCPTGSQWRVSHDGLRNLSRNKRLITTSKNSLRWKRYEEEIPGRHINAIWETTPPSQNKQYVVETPPKVLERCLLMTTDPGDLVLDITCGSGAMPFQAETWGRRWVAIDVAQVSIAIARERILTNTYPCHMLKDSPEGDKLDYEMEQGLLPPEKRAPFDLKDSYRNDPAKGFVTERQMRVSAATLAYGYDAEEPIRHPDRTTKDRNKVRVASPFTVESDSPYQSVAPENPRTQVTNWTWKPCSRIRGSTSTGIRNSTG